MSFIRLFWAQITLAVARAISGPKTGSTFNPSNGPCNVFAPHQNHNGPCHIINRFINSYKGNLLIDKSFIPFYANFGGTSI